MLKSVWVCSIRKANNLVELVVPWKREVHSHKVWVLFIIAANDLSAVTTKTYLHLLNNLCLVKWDLCGYDALAKHSVAPIIIFIGLRLVAWNLSWCLLLNEVQKVRLVNLVAVNVGDIANQLLCQGSMEYFLCWPSLKIPYLFYCTLKFTLITSNWLRF